MLLTCYNLYNQTGNPSTLTGIAPGGTNSTQNAATAPSEYSPMIGVPIIEAVQREVLDYTTKQYSQSSAAPVPQGTLLSFFSTGLNPTGCASWYIAPYAQAQHSPGYYGVVEKVSDAFDAPGGEATVVTEGPAQALCVAPTAGGAIAIGTLLGADGNGNLQPFQPPAGAPTPTVTAIGGSATTYIYALVAQSVNGTYSAIGTTGQTTGGAATLSGSAYNVITFVPVGDAVNYLVIRTSSGGTPSSLGLIGVVPAANGVFIDFGQVAAPNTSATQFFQRTAAGGTPTVTPSGTTGSTNYGYKITAILPNGVASAEGTEGTTSTGNATLSTTNYNNITWTNTTGAAYYAIDRTTAAGTPSSTGFIGYALSGTTGFNDIGYAATTFANAIVTTPFPTPPPGAVLAVALGALGSGTTTATLVPVRMKGR